MNTFRQSLEEIQSNPHTLNDHFDMLPGVPEALSITDTAYVLGVSKQTVERMIQAKELTLDPEERISKAGLVSYISHHILADLPVL